MQTERNCPERGAPGASLHACLMPVVSPAASARGGGKEEDFKTRSHFKTHCFGKPSAMPMDIAKILRGLGKFLLGCLSSSVNESAHQQPQQHHPASSKPQSQHHAAAPGGSTSGIDIPRLERYDSNICDFKEYDSQGNRIFTQADAFR
jgi:hypothetical protein